MSIVPQFCLQWGENRVWKKILRGHHRRGVKGQEGGMVNHWETVIHTQKVIWKLKEDEKAQEQNGVQVILSNDIHLKKSDKYFLNMLI